MILLIASLEITPDMVAVMAAQALAFLRSDKGVIRDLLPDTCQSTVGILEMTGRTAAAAPDVGIIVTFAIDMTTQTLTAKQIIHQLLFAPRRLIALGNFG